MHSCGLVFIDFFIKKKIRTGANISSSKRNWCLFDTNDFWCSDYASIANYHAKIFKFNSIRKK